MLIIDNYMKQTKRLVAGWDLWGGWWLHKGRLFTDVILWYCLLTNTGLSTPLERLFAGFNTSHKIYRNSSDTCHLSLINTIWLSSIIIPCFKITWDLSKTCRVIVTITTFFLCLPLDQWVAFCPLRFALCAVQLSAGEWSDSKMNTMNKPVKTIKWKSYTSSPRIQPHIRDFHWDPGTKFES